MCVHCLVDGYKYDQYENPLSGWTIGLAFESMVYAKSESLIELPEYSIFGTDVTDGDGYYCIAPEVQDKVAFRGNPVVFEEQQEGWTDFDVLVNGTTTPYSTDGFFDVYVEVELDTTTP